MKREKCSKGTRRVKKMERENRVERSREIRRCWQCGKEKKRHRSKGIEQIR